MKEIIQKAIEGGYKQDMGWLGPALEREYAEIFLDPLFWQALGKNLGWAKSKMMRVALGEVRCEKCGSDEIEIRIDEVKKHWYDFIDHIASGGDVDEFFQTLINNK